MNTARHESLQDHPAPHRDRVSGAKVLFGLLGSPVAWFLQLNAGFALASSPCFANYQRLLAPPGNLGWTHAAMVAALVAATIAALAAYLVSWRTFERTRDEKAGDHQHLMETGAGRTRFLALWGMILSAGFAVATLVTGVAFIVLPRCAG